MSGVPSLRLGHPSGATVVNDDMWAFLHDVEVMATEAIETACEQALQTGFCGVRVRRFVEGGNYVVEAQATPDVPYGFIEEAWGHLSPMGVRGVPE